MIRALAFAVLALTQTACLTATRWTEIHLEDTKRVQIEEAPKNAKVKRTARDVRVNGESVLAHGGLKGSRRPTIVTRVEDAPDAIRVKDGVYTWRRAGVTATTTRANIASADVRTHWSQRLDVVPSLAAMVFGTIFAVGFGVAGGAFVAEGIDDGDPAELGRGAALLGAAAGGGALATYGVVTYLLITGPPSKDPLEIVEE
jgi:hypothetical protein